MAELSIRRIEAQDREICGRILFEAFRSIAERHDFPPDFETPEVATAIMGFLIDGSWGVVAERDGRILGSNFLKEGDPISAVGPISVDPAVQESGIGRRLMQAVIDRGRKVDGIRLVQDAFNATSMALYASLGFDVREPLVYLTGNPRGAPIPGIEVRPFVADDLADCAALCRRVHAITRSHELSEASKVFAPFVALREGRIRAYATTLEFWFGAHAVAETVHDMQALMLGVAQARSRPLAFLLPTRQAELFRWALSEGLRIVKPMTLMSMGPYTEPRGAFLPSVGY